MRHKDNKENESHVADSITVEVSKNVKDKGRKVCVCVCRVHTLMRGGQDGLVVRMVMRQFDPRSPRHNIKIHSVCCFGWQPGLTIKVM